MELSDRSALRQKGRFMNETSQTSEPKVRSSDLLGEARVEAIKGYMQNRLSLVEAMQCKSSYYDSHLRDREWIVEEIKRIDNAVASLLASPNGRDQRPGPRDA